MTLGAAPSGSFLQACSSVATSCMQLHGLDGNRAAAIADEIAKALRTQYGGTTVYICRRSFTAEERAAEVKRLDRQGLSMREIAARMGITQQYGYALRARNTSTPTGRSAGLASKEK